MVSGAAHTTAHTIRPSFEIIKTAPGVSTVSSVFLMCLADRVLVFGDCAVVPDPTVEQLADIAISSAATAAQFGIDPQIAMLSYSTGESGSGADVDKVREATELVRERRPDLLVEGPIQYDAAVEPTVAAHEAARIEGGRPGHGVRLPGSEHRQQHLQGGATQRRRGRDRPGPAGPEQAGQRPVPRRADRRTSSTPSPSPRSRRRASKTAGAAAERSGPGHQFGLVLDQVPAVDPDGGEAIASGLVERIGEPDGVIGHRQRRHRQRASRSDRRPRRGPAAGLRDVRARRAWTSTTAGIAAVGHRVVHGGEVFYRPTLITADVIAEIARLSALAPLHNPANVIGIEARMRVFPDVPHVAVFDTAFFHTLPAEAADLRHRRARSRQHTGAPLRIPRHLARVRLRPGRRGARPGQHELNQIVLHLGNGASASAIAAAGDRHLDGPDPARGSGDGHPQRRHRPGHRDAPAAQRGTWTWTPSTTCSTGVRA